MGGFGTFFIILAVILVLFGAVFFVRGFLKAQKKNALLSRNRLDRKTIFEYLRTEFSEKNVFCGYLFPFPKNKQGFVSRYAPIDAVVITAGGVAVIDIQNFDAQIDSASADRWVIRRGDQITEIASPVRQNEVYKKVINDLLRARGIHNVPVYSIVVYTGNADFTVPYDNLVSAREMIGLLSALHTERILTVSDLLMIRRILSENKNTKSEADAALKKIYG